MAALRDTLGRRLHHDDIRLLCHQTAEAGGGDGLLKELYDLTGHEDDRVAYNALWVLTHLPARNLTRLRSRRHELTDRLLAESHIGKRRLLLTLLDHMPTTPHDVRTDYLDYCLAGIQSAQPYGIRALCIKQAFAQCRHHPELIGELAALLEALSADDLSPGLRSACRNTLRRIRKACTG